MMIRRASMFLAMLLCVGCAQEKIPTYPNLSAAQTLERLRERSQQIKTVWAQGSLQLTRDDGQSVLLDAAAALAPPDNARIRAWKFGQAIFDLTLRPDGIYVLSGDAQQQAQINSAGDGLANIVRRWIKTMNGEFDAADAQLLGDDVIIRQEQPDGTRLLCRIDRRTITPREFHLRDPSGVERFSLRLDRYIQSNGEVWPTRVRMVSQQGTIELSLDDVTINGDLPAQIFTPPRRAVKLP